MNSEHKDKLVVLRQKVPVGLKHGLKLLEHTKGNLEEAELIFKQEILSLTIKKTGVTPDIANKHLALTNYDLSLTLKSIDEERYSLTERILKNYRTHEEALWKLFLAVSEKEKLESREHWHKLEPEVVCFLTIIEWLGFEEWEGFDCAVYSNVDIVTEQIENQLSLPEIAGIIRKARKIHEKQLQNQKRKLSENGWVTSNFEFKQQNDFFNQQRPLLIKALYNFVISNIGKFPS